MISDGPLYASASRIASPCAGRLPHRDARDVHISVRHCDQRQVFFRKKLAAGGKFCYRTLGVDFDICPPVLEYTSVSSTRMLTLRPDAMTWSSLQTRYRTPTVAAHNPDAFLQQIIRERKQMLRIARGHALQFIFEDFDSAALLVDLRFIRLVGIKNRVCNSSQLWAKVSSTTLMHIPCAYRIESRKPRRTPHCLQKENLTMPVRVHRNSSSTASSEGSRRKIEEQPVALATTVCHRIIASPILCTGFRRNRNKHRRIQKAAEGTATFNCVDLRVLRSASGSVRKKSQFARSCSAAPVEGHVERP